MIKRRIIKLLVIGIAIFFLGGIGGFVFDKYFAPYLSSCKLFSNYDFFQKNGKNTTIIRETERIVVKDGNTINEIASGAAQSVVDIVAIKDSVGAAKLVSAVPVSGKKGTGTILTNDGVIVTHQNNVFEEGAVYHITTFDGNTFEAKLLEINNFFEIAFLKIDGVNLPAIPFANSDDLIIGKKVIALGSSLGNQKVGITEIILSDYDDTFNLIGGRLSSSEKLEGVFKSNINENEDYIGAPVIDYNRELIAITSAITNDNKKQYFHIPANKIKEAMNMVFSQEKKEKAKLGVYYISINDFYARLNNLPVKEGALIYSQSDNQGLAVIAGSAASEAGLRVGDIITTINGEKINLKNSLSFYINKYNIGDEVILNVIREGEEIEIKVIF